VINAAYELNVPASVERAAESAAVPLNSPASPYSLFTIDGQQVIAESVKKPEAGRDGSLMIRLYESLGGACGTVLRFSRELAAAEETDMLENKREDLLFSGKTLPLEFRAFEIKTLIIRFR
jgi:alpha-mannosidase